MLNVKYIRKKKSIFSFVGRAWQPNLAQSTKPTQTTPASLYAPLASGPGVPVQPINRPPLSLCGPRLSGDSTPNVRSPPGRPSLPHPVPSPTSCCSACSLLCMPWAILFAPVQPRRPLAPLSQRTRHRCHCDAREEHLDDKPTQCVTTALHVPPRRRAIPSCVRRSPTLLPLGARSLSRGCLCAISHPPPARTRMDKQRSLTSRSCCYCFCQHPPRLQCAAHAPATAASLAMLCTDTPMQAHFALMQHGYKRPSPLHLVRPVAAPLSAPVSHHRAPLFSSITATVDSPPDDPFSSLAGPSGALR
jgi:hypothetical protein